MEVNYVSFFRFKVKNVLHHKMKKTKRKKYQTVETVTKSNRQIFETHNTNIHDSSFSLLNKEKMVA
jgi:hypothetical protein